MNPHLCSVALRPRSPFEVFDLTLAFIRGRARPFAWLALATILPAFAACLGLAWLGNFAPWTLIYPILLGPLLHAPFTVLGGDLLFDEQASAWSGIAKVFKRTAAVILTLVAEALSWALVCTGFGIVLLPGLVYLPETALLERVDIGRGVQRTLRLASGQVGVAIVGALARWLLLAWGAAVGELGGQFIVGFVLQLGTPFGTLYDGVITPYLILGILLSHPLFAIYRLLLYVDVRTRMEGWDLQVGLRALGMGTSEASR